MSTMPIGFYDVSELQQHDATPTVSDMIKANTLVVPHVDKLQAWSQAGVRLKLKFEQTLRAPDGSSPKKTDLAAAMTHDVFRAASRRQIAAKLSDVSDFLRHL